MSAFSLDSYCIEDFFFFFLDYYVPMLLRYVILGVVPISGTYPVPVRARYAPGTYRVRQVAYRNILMGLSRYGQDTRPIRPGTAPIRPGTSFFLFSPRARAIPVDRAPAHQWTAWRCTVDRAKTRPQPQIPFANLLPARIEPPYPQLAPKLQTTGLNGCL